jgi:hypothetical protein
MLMINDPFRQFGRLTQQVLGTAARPAAMPMDAWREGNELWLRWTCQVSTSNLWTWTSSRMS